MTPPESLRAFPLSCGRGTHPVAWQSQFHGCTGLGRAGCVGWGHSDVLPVS